MIAVLLIAAGVAVLSWATAKEAIFLEIREKLVLVTQNKKRHFLIRKVAYLPTCEFCCSFWFTLLATITFQAQLYYEDWRGYILFHLVTWAVAVGYMSVFQLTRVEIRSEQAKADEKEQDLL